MKWLSDEAVNRLREAVDAPDLTGTKYRLVEKVASGGMGTVYLAEDASLGRRVAVKVMSLTDASGALASRMMREARIVAQLEHPSIVPIHDVGTLPDGRVFYAMKFVEGSRLDQYVKDAASPADLLRIFQKVCEAVAFAHAHGVIHRDLKPENIMVGAFGEVLVMDWGVAKVIQISDCGLRIAESSARAGNEPQAGNEPTAVAFSHDAETLVMTSRAESGTMTAHGTVLGTPAYMSPEQAMGQTDALDERTDVYALGAILYFLLTAHAPFEANSTGDVRQLVIDQHPLRPRQRNAKIARRIEAVCLKAMSQNPAERYTSAQEMAADTARFLDGLPVSAYRENIFERAGRWLGRNRFFVLLILAYLLMRFLVLLFTGR
jgi:serine/threonine protein kinase